MQDKPKFIFNHGTGKFEGLTPEDDVKIEDLKKAKAAADINKFVKSTLPPDEPADVNTINKELNKYRRPDDQIKTFDNLDPTTYPSDPKQREKLFEPIYNNNVEFLQKFRKRMNVMNENGERTEVTLKPIDFRDFDRFS